MKITLAKGFLLIFIGGAVLLALSAAGTERLPESLRLLRIFLGIIFVILAPGYALQAALFPHPGELDPLARAAFSFGLSIATTPIVLIALNGLGLGAQFEPITISLCLIIFAGAVIFSLRRRAFAESDSAQTIRFSFREWWASQDRFSRWIYGVLGVGFVTAAVSGLIVSQEAPAAPFTEFYLLDSQGLAMDYPREVTARSQIVCLLGIINHEGQPSDYRIVAVEGEDQALTTLGPISLADGETWEGALTIMLAQPGEGQKVEFLLERIGSPWPYRTLRIWMNVAPAKETPSAFPAGISSSGGIGRGNTERILRRTLGSADRSFVTGPKTTAEVNLLDRLWVAL